MRSMHKKMRKLQTPVENLLVTDHWLSVLQAMPATAHQSSLNNERVDEKKTVCYLVTGDDKWSHQKLTYPLDNYFLTKKAVPQCTLFFIFKRNVHTYVACSSLHRLTIQGREWTLWSAWVLTHTYVKFLSLPSRAFRWNLKFEIASRNKLIFIWKTLLNSSTSDCTILYS